MKNIAHQQTQYLKDSSNALLATREKLEKLQGEQLTEFDITGVANSSGEGCKITSSMMENGSYRYPFATNTIGTQDRTTLSVAGNVSPKVNTITLLIDNFKETEKATIDIFDQSAGYNDLLRTATTITRNTPIVEMNKAAFKLLAVSAPTANWTANYNLDSKDSQALYADIAKYITGFKSRQDKYQSNGIQSDADLVIPCTYEVIAKIKNALTMERTGSETQADLFLKSLKAPYNVNGVQLLVTNHLPAGVHFLVMTRGMWGALAFKIAFQSAVEKQPGKINTYIAWSEYTYGMKVLFPEYVYGVSQTAKPTK